MQPSHQNKWVWSPHVPFPTTADPHPYQEDKRLHCLLSMAERRSVWQQLSHTVHSCFIDPAHSFYWDPQPVVKWEDMAHGVAGPVRPKLTASTHSRLAEHTHNLGWVWTHCLAAKRSVFLHQSQSHPNTIFCYWLIVRLQSQQASGQDLLKLLP